MPSLSYQSVYYATGASHTRQPRSTSSYGGFTPFPGLNPSGPATLTTGTPFGALAVEPTLTDGGTTYNFGFMSVTGLLGGGLLSANPGIPPAPGTVGTSPVVVLVVYFPQGGGGNGKGSDAFIDSFDETLGTLVDDDFVTVSTDGILNSGLTGTGNVDGVVDTTDSDVTIAAYAHITPTGANFDQWQLFQTDGVASASSLNLKVSGGSTTYAFAFYQNPAKIFKEHKDKEFKEYLKDYDKYFQKERFPEVPIKTLGKEKDGKELAEGGFGNPGDPAYFISEVARLNEKISKIESLLETAILGQAFIREGDRPAVGPNMARKDRSE